MNKLKKKKWSKVPKEKKLYMKKMKSVPEEKYYTKEHKKFQV